MDEDGGYYAIKGFDFQIDKTILALFKGNSQHEKIAIEQIQDINTDAEVIQVKYKETQNFANSKIREPVVKLIDEFIADKTGKTFILYCHFKDRAACSMSFLPSGIDEILEISLGKKPSESHTKNFNKIQSISPVVRRDFSKKFVLQFADDYDAHFGTVLDIISKQPFCGSQKETLFLYHIIADHLRKVVTSNVDKKRRVCDRNDICVLLDTGKRAIFHAAFSQIKSRQSYLSFLKSRVHGLYANHNNCILIGQSFRTNSYEQMAGLIKIFLSNYFKSANCDVNPPLLLIRDDLVVDVKKLLIDFGVRINDGYEEIRFSPQFLIEPPIANLKVIGRRVGNSLGEISFKVRIASLSRISELKKNYLPDRLMYFDVPEIDVWNNVPMFSVDDLDLDEMLMLLRVVR